MAGHQYKEDWRQSIRTQIADPKARSRLILLRRFAGSIKASLREITDEAG